jgi:hypothetical protein
MTRISMLFVASLLLLALSGCASVTSGLPTESNVSGEAWYVKTVSFIALPVATHIYFCPKAQGKGPAKCVEAQVHEAVETPAAPEMPGGGYGAPPAGGYGAPPAGGYGAPPAGGYGAPPAGGYGAPPAGGYGAPPAGGYQQPTVPTPQPPTPGY